MNERPHFTLIAAPQLSFGELSRQLAGLGWRPESASESPILPGEPELALFVQSHDATVIHYTFNPVVRLRVLQFRGANAELQRQQVGRNIPVVSWNDLRTWLDSNDIRRMLLGLF